MSGHHRDRGAVMPIACLSMAAMFLATSFTVDLGRIMERGRALQLVADLAALDASRSVDPDLPASAQYEVVRLAALSSLARNGVDPGSAEVNVHLRRADGTRLPADSSELPDAVEVELRDRVELLFQVGSVDATRRAVARPSIPDPTAALRLGSGLLTAAGDWSGLSSSDVALLDTLFGSMLGGGYSLDAVGYNGLASVDATLGGFAAAAGFGNDLDAALAASFTLDEFLGILLDVVGAQAPSGAGDDAIAALAELRSTASALTGLQTVSLGALVDVDPSVTDELDELLLPLDRLVRGGIFLARDGTVVTVPGLTVGVPGVLSTTVSLGIVEPARTVVGPAGSTVESAQIRFRISITANVGLVTATIPFVVEAADTSATLLDIECDGDAAVGATVGLTTSGARIGLGTLNDALLVQAGDPAFTSATVTTLSIGIGLLTIPVPITTSDDLDIAAQSQDVYFSAAEFGTTKRVGAPLDIGTLVASTLTHGQVNGTVAALLAPLLAGLRSTVATILDDAVSGLVEPLLALTGANLGYADVSLGPPDCTVDAPRLIA